MKGIGERKELADYVALSAAALRRSQTRLALSSFVVLAGCLVCIFAALGMLSLEVDIIEGGFSIGRGVVLIATGILFYSGSHLYLLMTVSMRGKEVALMGDANEVSVLSRHKKAIILDSFMILLSLVVMTAGVLLLNFGFRTICMPWFPLYDPEIGICECDEASVLFTTSDEPFFNITAETNPVKIAYIGDVSITKFEEMLRFIQADNAEVLVVNGDLTYAHAHSEFRDIVTEVLGPSFPVLITVGNHDTGEFSKYQVVALDLYNAMHATYDESTPETEKMLCKGVVGIDQICSFRNMGIVLSGIGSTCLTDPYLETQLESHLEVMDEAGLEWKSIFIHKNQRSLQTGKYKTDEVGWRAYELALQHGASVFNSHEHTYARTKTIIGVGEEFFASSVSGKYVESVENDETVGSTFQEGLVLKNGTSIDEDISVLNIQPGSMHVASNGIGGKDVRDAKKSLVRNPWWASTYNTGLRMRVTFGAHFCEYDVGEFVDGVALCYMKTLDGNIFDKYILHSL